MEHLLNLENISLIYHTLENETCAIKNLSFWVDKGEFVAIIGPFGCGKTSILYLVAG